MNAGTEASILKALADWSPAKKKRIFEEIREYDESLNSGLVAEKCLFWNNFLRIHCKKQKKCTFQVQEVEYYVELKTGQTPHCLRKITEISVR